MAKSVLTTIFEELAASKNYSATAERFKVLLPEIENLLEKRVIFYFASETGTEVSSLINDEDAFVIENLLSSNSSKKDLVLIIHSNGGLATSAERIIDVCRNYCKGRKDGSQFFVVVPKKAKSAATILSLGADKIFLRNTAELGPVDPQFSVTDNNGNTQFIPAYLQVDAIDNLLEPGAIFSLERIKSLFVSDGKPFTDLPKEIKIKLFEQCNYALYVNAKNELGLSDSIIEKIANEKTRLNPKISQKDFDIFRDPHLTKSHGRLINLNDLKGNPLCEEGIICGIRKLVDTDEKSATLDGLLWELYVRKNRMLNDPGNNIVKTIECVDEFFSTSGKKLGQPK